MRVFDNEKVFNDDISGWDVSNVTSMRCIFRGASSFYQDVTDWDVSNVTDMSDMFSGASSFNQDVSGWDVSKVTTMRNMFVGTEISFFLEKECGVSSFFEGVFRSMPRVQRIRLFRWDRRKNFILYLVKQR